MIPNFLKANHSRFAFAGDEWLISYAHLSASFLAIYPATFSVAMVLELYLKAYAEFFYGSGRDATDYRHDIRKLFEDLIRDDSDFPKEIILDSQLSRYPLFELDRDHWASEWFLQLSEDTQSEIRKHYEIYMAMAYAVDLKYGISPSLPRYSGRVISSSWTKLNPWIASFVVAVRKRIGHPLEAIDDRLIYALRNTDLHPHAIPFLEGIHQKTFQDSPGK